jgi:hypothetical protein
MFDSIRIRLTIWYLAVIAAVLIAFAALAYVWILHILVRETDNNLIEMAENFAAEVRSPQPGEAGSIEAKLSEETGEFHFNDYQFAVYDTNGRSIASTVANNDIRGKLDVLARQAPTGPVFTDLAAGHHSISIRAATNSSLFSRSRTSRRSLAVSSPFFSSRCR